MGIIKIGKKFDPTVSPLSSVFFPTARLNCVSEKEVLSFIIKTLIVRLFKQFLVLS